MIKFRYKRKEPTNGGSISNNSTKSSTNKTVDNKSDGKDDNKHNTLKCETSASKASTPQIIKTKTSTEQEYMEDCIRAIVVSA